MTILLSLPLKPPLASAKTRQPGEVGSFVTIAETAWRLIEILPAAVGTACPTANRTLGHEVHFLRFCVVFNIWRGSPTRHLNPRVLRTPLLICHGWMGAADRWLLATGDWLLDIGEITLASKKMGATRLSGGTQSHRVEYPAVY